MGAYVLLSLLWSLSNVVLIPVNFNLIATTVGSSDWTKIVCISLVDH